MPWTHPPRWTTPSPPPPHERRLMKAWAPPEEAPAGQLVPVRIRLGVRLAVRDARVHWGHALVVMALVALPVSLIVGFYLLGMSVAAAEAAQPIPGRISGRRRMAPRLTPMGGRRLGGLTRSQTIGDWLSGRCLTHPVEAPCRA